MRLTNMGKLLNVRHLDGKLETLMVEGSEGDQDAKGQLLLTPPFIDLLCMEKADKKLFAQGGTLFLFNLVPSQKVGLQTEEGPLSFQERLLVSSREPLETLARFHGEVEGIVCTLEKEAFDSVHIDEVLQLAAQKNWMVWLTFSRQSYGIKREEMISTPLLNHLQLFLEKALDRDSQVIYLPAATKEEVDLIKEANAKEITAYLGLALSHLLFLPDSLRKKLLRLVGEGKFDFLSSCVGHPDFDCEARFTASHASALLYTLGQRSSIPFEEWVKLAYLNPEQIFGFSRGEVRTLIHTTREIVVSELDFPLLGNVEYILEGSRLASLKTYDPK
jgi:hypothetical protein